MRIPKVGTLVYVEWFDPHAHDGPWTSHAEAADTAIERCRSVGWLLSKSKDAICIAAHVSTRFKEDVGGAMTLPRACVTSLKTLENPRDRT